MVYKIKNYSFDQAKKLGVLIYPSKKKNKKIDVYKGDDFICSIGDTRYDDFPTFYEEYGEEFANQRRKAYHQRHSKEDIEGTPGFYALRILW